MVKIKLENTAKIKLQKGNKIIERNYIDYENNKKVWDFKGYKPVENNVKEEKVVELKPKKRKTRKKKDEPMDLETD
jgi:hypothetical protein|tara:strand:+ start:564 stop:791 length:228 start_codon:yes stop_codon:yes gene_type:complete